MHIGKRVLLTDRISGHFCCAPAKWRHNRREALDFGSVMNAFDFAEKHGLRHVDALIAFEDPRLDVRLNVTM